jgi:hypothetical protein
MQQRFNSRNYSIRDFAEWGERGELVLSPKFQRRDVWNAKARSYLMDTIIRGKPIPKVYMRVDINSRTRRATREVVDGQQRLRTVLNFLKDGFKISRAHNDDYGDSYFSGLPEDVQADILKYEFVVDLLQDMPDSEIYDVFARINTYTATLKPQELRNARWFGDFKSCVYALANDLLSFIEKNQIFTSKQVLRMAEAEFISDLLLAMHEGIRAGSKPVIDKAYADYDDRFSNRKRHEKRFKETIDLIGRIVGDDLPTMKFRATRLFYPLFCAIYHMQFRLPKLKAPRRTIKTSNLAKLKTTLEQIDNLINEAVDAEKRHENPDLNAEERKFYEAYDEHWVHAANRTVLTQYLCKEFIKVLR